jgi:energy-coupling factor transport system ATP-binding protein
MLHAPRTDAASPVAALCDVSVCYPFAARDAVGPVSFTLNRGERVLLLGPSGSGKSTLLLTLTGLVPNHVPADVRGGIALFGEPVAARTTADWALKVAQFFQDADQTLCGMSIEDEIAFPLENRGVPEAEIHRRISEVMAELLLPEAWRRRSSAALSGGERQLVALASALVQNADLFIADEPTAHLAPEAAERFHRILAKPRPRQTVLVVDHRFDGLIEHVDRIIALGPNGTVCAEGPTRRVLRENLGRFRELGIWCPPAIALDALLMEAGHKRPLAPLSVAEALPTRCDERSRAAVRSFLSAYGPTARAPQTAASEPIVGLQNADCAPFLARPVLRGISLSLRAGSCAALVGPNGAGKTTLGATLAGILPVKSGRRFGPLGGVAFQRPENQLLTGRGGDEIASSLPRSLSAEAQARQVSQALARWDLCGFEDRHPYELSQGQKRRLALASLTVSDRWPLIVLDEPTAGLDAAGAASLAGYIVAMRAGGKAILLITQDIDFAATVADRLIILAAGRIAADGDPASILADTGRLRRAGLSAPAYLPAARWLAERSRPC